MRKRLFLSLLSLLFVGLSWSQCPMCKAALTSGRTNGKNKYERQVGDGINRGILFLMAVPYVLLAGAGFAFYKSNLKKKARL